MQSVLLRRVAQLSSRLSRFLAERSADFVNGATPHNDDIFPGTSIPIERRVMLSPLKAENSLRAIGVGYGRELDRSFPTVLNFFGLCVQV